MNEGSSTPPPIPSLVKPTNTIHAQAATFSLVAPFVAIGIGIFLQPQVRGHRLAMVILGLVSILLIVLGFGFGIFALVGTKRYGKAGIFGKAIAGTCICGLLTLLMLVSIPAIMKAVERAKAIERQRLEQRQP